jgi:hypothetical protein
MQRMPRAARVSSNAGVAETTNRILQEVSCAQNWAAVEAILQVHRELYYSLAPRARERLNEQIRDAMRER